MVERLKEIRKALNLNQHNFARQLKISQSTLAMMEVGKRPISEKTIRLVCSVFNVNENWFQTGEGQMFLDSPVKEEFVRILNTLSPQTQEFLLVVAKGIVELQEKEKN